MSLAKCLKKLKIDSSHEDSIISGLASLTEQGNLEGYRKATLALDQAMNDTLDEQEDIHIQLEKQGYSFKEDNSVKDSKLLEEKLNKQGYTFTITPKNVRDFVAKDKTREAQATTATNLASKFGKRITWIDAKGDFGINGVVVPNIKDVIFLDVNTKYPAHAVMGHELSHHLEYDKPDVYKDLVASMEGLLKNHKEYADKYKIEGASHKDIVKEMIGDIMGDNFTKQDFWNKLADQDRSLFTKIADTIKAWLEQFIKSDNLGSDAFVKDVKKAREVIALAVAKYKDVQQPTQSAEAKFHKVWHGSPHDHNKFDSTKIGTGEGAQIYGYGHYFAESKGVAEYYKEQLTGTMMPPSPALFTSKGVNYAKNGNKYLKGDNVEISKQEYSAAFVEAQDQYDIDKKTKGKLYEVELAPEQDEYLLWDKPLSEQSDKVKRLLQNELRKHITIRSTQKNFTDVMYDGEELGSFKDHKVPNVVQNVANHIPFSGEDLYKGYTEKQGSDKKASDYLHSLGIRGIKYLAGDSRDKGEGAYNYVIFDDNDVSIIAKFSRAIPYTAKEPIASNVSLEDLKAHPKYQEAKHGNLDSAISLVNDLISKEDVIKASSAFGKDVIYVPVTQFEKDGINRIPYAIAQKYASETGASINDSLYVKDKAFHTGMKMMERLIARTRFEGDIPKGKYVLVDDVTSSGATLADLSSYIQEQGGDVIGSVLLTNAMRGDKLIADKSLTKLLETKYGNEIRELFGIEPSSLTREEAKYLQGFRTTDELRASANKASSSRAERIRIKALPKSEDAKFSRKELEVSPKLYSKLEQVIENASDKIFSTGKQVKLWLQSNAGKLGVKKDEIYWSGIDNWLDAQGKVSKQQVVEFVRNNGVQVEDVTLGVESAKILKRIEEIDDRTREISLYPRDANTAKNESDQPELDEISAEWEMLNDKLYLTKSPKHNNDKLTLPGGTDYKELVVTVPTIEPHNAGDTTHFGDTGQGKQIGWLRMNTRDGGLFIESYSRSVHSKVEVRGLLINSLMLKWTDTKSYLIELLVILLILNIASPYRFRNALN